MADMKSQPLLSKRKKPSESTSERNTTKEAQMDSDKKSKNKKTAADFNYSRGPSKLGLSEKYKTKTQVCNRLIQLGHFIKGNVRKINQYKRLVGAHKAEARRLLILAKKQDYQNVLTRAAENGFDGLGKVTAEFSAKQREQDKQEE
jgi:hypothetical protein